MDYVNKVKDVANDETNQNPNESSENATVAGDRTDSEDSEDEIPLVELEAMRRRKRRKEEKERILKEAASDDNFKEIAIPFKKEKVPETISNRSMNQTVQAFNGNL